MAKQIYFEDVEVGTEIGPLEKNPTTQQLVKYAGASGDFYQIHYDKDFALANKLPGVILHGALKNGFPVHYHFRLELWRKGGLFDHLARDAEWDAFVRLDPLTSEYDLIRSSGTLEHFTHIDAVSRALASPFHVDLLPSPGAGTRYYYVATLQIESLSESELAEVERWLTGDVGPAISHTGNIGDALAEGFRRLLIRFSGLPRRTLEARSGIFEAGR